MTDLSDCVSVGFTTHPADDGPKTNLELTFERAGKADPTKTQVMLRLKSPAWRPEWLQDLQDNRRSWKNRTQHIARLYSINLVLDPPNPECTIKEISHDR
jgi:hypothetical protein